LRRDDPESADYRIDTLLLKKAREGVLVRASPVCHPAFRASLSLSLIL